MPLGDVWRGVCRAEAAPFPPDDATTNDLCNMGYARGRCSRYPRGETSDAVRFRIARDQNELIQIEYVVESDHHPHTHGTLEYQRSVAAAGRPGGDTIIERQAVAYLTSYLRRRPVAA
jgi:hypothetical protein